MLHDEICTYEVAKLAKEKGFPQEIEIGTHWTTTKYYKNACLGEYFVGNEEKVETTEDKIAAIHLIKNEGVGIVMPTQSLLQRWLREEKGMQIYIDSDLDFDDETFVYEWQIANKENFDNGGFEIHRYNSEEFYSTYELALEDAMKYALENLI